MPLRMWKLQLGWQVTETFRRPISPIFQHRIKGRRRLGIALNATMSALVPNSLIASTKSVFDTNQLAGLSLSRFLFCSSMRGSLREGGEGGAVLAVALGGRRNRAILARRGQLIRCVPCQRYANIEPLFKQSDAQRWMQR